MFWIIYIFDNNVAISKIKPLPAYLLPHLAKTLTENRVLMLTEKINSLKIGQRAEAERKLDTLDRQVSALEEELEQVVVNFSDKHCELKHIVLLNLFSSAR